MSLKVHRPHFKEKLFFLLSGIIISVPFPILANYLINRYLTSSLPPFFSNLITVALVAPILEEFAKIYPLFYRHGETKKSIMTLGFYSGLGFGIAEFVLFVIFLSTPFLYRVPALLFHATNTMISSYGIAIKQPFKFYVISVFLHFLNNFAVATWGSSWIIGSFIAIFSSYFIALFLYRRTPEVPITKEMSE